MRAPKSEKPTHAPRWIRFAAAAPHSRGAHAPRDDARRPRHVRGFPRGRGSLAPRGVPRRAARARPRRRGSFRLPQPREGRSRPPRGVRHDRPLAPVPRARGRARSLHLLAQVRATRAIAPLRVLPGVRTRANDPPRPSQGPPTPRRPTAESAAIWCFLPHRVGFHQGLSSRSPSRSRPGVKTDPAKGARTFHRTPRGDKKSSKKRSKKLSAPASSSAGAFPPPPPSSPFSSRTSPRFHLTPPPPSPLLPSS